MRCASSGERDCLLKVAQGWMTARLQSRGGLAMMMELNSSNHKLAKEIWFGSDQTGDRGGGGRLMAMGRDGDSGDAEMRKRAPINAVCAAEIRWARRREREALAAAYDRPTRRVPHARTFIRGLAPGRTGR